MLEVEQQLGAPELRSEGMERVERMGGDGDERNARPLGDQRLVAQEIRLGSGRCDGGNELLEDAVLFAERQRISHCRVESIEPDDHVRPVIFGSQRHFHFGDDAVGAVGVHGLVQIRAGQL